MKLLHTADWHLGKNWGNISRLPDMDGHIVPEIIDIAIKEKVALMVIAGDVFDSLGTKSLDLCASLLSRHLRRLLDAGISIAVVPGNHNHDHWHMFRLLEASLKVQASTSGARLVVFARPEIQEIAGIQVFGFPYLTLVNFRNHLAEQGIQFGAESTAQNQALSRLYEDLLREFKAKRLDGKRPAVFVGHFTVAGGQMKTDDGEDTDFEANYAWDLTVSKEALLNSDQVGQYNAMGHLHVAQALPDTVAPICYPGAPDYLERQEKKRKPQVLIVEVPQHGKAQHEQRELQSVTPFIKDTVTNQDELRALAETIAPEKWPRVLGDLTIQVADPTAAETLRAEAYEIFPRLKEAGTIVVRLPGAQNPKSDLAGQLARVAEPEVVFRDYFQKTYADDPRLPYLQEALQDIMNEISGGARQ